MAIHYYYNESKIVLIATLNQETTLNFLKNRSKMFLSEQPLCLGLSHQPLGHLLWILSSGTLSCPNFESFQSLNFEEVEESAGPLLQHDCRGDFPTSGRWGGQRASAAVQGSVCRGPAGPCTLWCWSSQQTHHSVYFIQVGWVSTSHPI